MVYRVQVERNGLWETVNDGEFAEFPPAGELARAYRGDGYTTRVRQPENCVADDLAAHRRTVIAKAGA